MIKTSQMFLFEQDRVLIKTEQLSLQQYIIRLQFLYNIHVMIFKSLIISWLEILYGRLESDKEGEYFNENFKNNKDYSSTIKPCIKKC